MYIHKIEIHSKRMKNKLALIKQNKILIKYSIA